MIFVEDLVKIIKKNKINFFTGVPDSILKNFSIYLQNNSKEKHLVATNEGSAVGLGIGHYLATKKIPCIYMQNSGLSNAINPLISIASKEVYSVPLFLIIGWRGSPKMQDEPQHMAKGKITPSLLKLLKINFCVVNTFNDLAKLNKLIKNSSKSKKIVACLIKKGVLKIKTRKKNKKSNKNNFYRSNFIEKFLENIPKNSRIISTTGYTSRELMQVRKEKKIKNGKDFYMVGGMGHSSTVALGYALKTNKKIFCLDGDGSVLMHLGSLRTIGFANRKNFKHIILNNNCHESVGGQPTNAHGINFKNLTKSIGYKNYYKISKLKEIKKILKIFNNSTGPSCLEVKIKSGTMKNLSRPKNLIKTKNLFMSN